MLVDLGMVPTDAQVAAVVVPAQDPAPPPGKGEEFGKASPIALVVIILLGIATVLLIVSMTRRLKRLPKSFDPADDVDDTQDGAVQGGAAQGGAAQGGAARSETARADVPDGRRADGDDAPRD